MSTELTKTTEFLNVDLEIRAQSGLRELVDALRPSAFALHQTEDFTTLELLVSPQSVDEAIARYAESIQSLPLKLREIWNQCKTRRLDIGIQAGLQPKQTFYPVSEKSVSLLADIRTELVFTVYGAEVNTC